MSFKEIRTYEVTCDDCDKTIIVTEDKYTMPQLPDGWQRSLEKDWTDRCPSCHTNHMEKQ